MILQEILTKNFILKTVMGLNNNNPKKSIFKKKKRDIARI